MLIRGALGSRRNLVNSDEVQEELDRLGFQIINPESETPQSLVGKLCEVEMAIAIEGSATKSLLSRDAAFVDAGDD